jgi:hypothetical protein
MTSPTTLTFVATFAADPSQRAANDAQCDAYAEHVRTAEPGTLALTLAFNKSGSELHYLQTTESPEAFDMHMRGAQRLLGDALGRFTLKEAVVYGRPGGILTQALEANRAGGATVTVVPTQVAGFHRDVAA